MCVCRPPLLSLDALPFASSYSAWFSPQCSLLSVCNHCCQSETLKASVCCVHSLFLRGISTPRIPSYPILHLPLSKWKHFSEIMVFQIDFLNDCSSRWIVVVFAASAIGCFLTSWHMYTPGYWSLYLIHWRLWFLFLLVFTLKRFWRLPIFTHSLCM